MLALGDNLMLLAYYSMGVFSGILLIFTVALLSKKGEASQILEENRELRKKVKRLENDISELIRISSIDPETVFSHELSFSINGIIDSPSLYPKLFDSITPKSQEQIMYFRPGNYVMRVSFALDDKETGKTFKQNDLQRH